MSSKPRLTLDEKVVVLQHLVAQLASELEEGNQRVLKEQLKWDLIRLRQEMAELERLERELKKARNKLNKLTNELLYKNRNKT